MSRRSFRSSGGSSSATSIMIGVLMAIITIFFVIAVVPELEAMVIDPAWAPMTQTMLGLVKWILPVGAIIAVIVLIFRQVRGH